MRLWFGPLLVPAALATGCSTSTPPGGCDDNGGCDAGNICIGGECAQLCSGNSDCPTGMVCSGQDVCTDPGPEALPQIDGVAGNDPADPTKITDGLIITGSGLATAALELRANAMVMMTTIRAQDNERVEIVLPADARSGDYVLVASNQVGTAQAPVTLTLPELTGGMLVDRINTDAMGTLDSARLDVGTLSGTVAAGDHRHDADYVNQNGDSITGNLTVSGTISGGTITSGAMSGTSIDLGMGADDDLDAADVTALTAGPMTDASALHTHAGLGAGGCYNLYYFRHNNTQNQNCATDYTEVIHGIYTWPRLYHPTNAGYQGGGSGICMVSNNFPMWTDGDSLPQHSDWGNWSGGANAIWQFGGHGGNGTNGNFMMHFAGNAATNKDAGVVECKVCCK